MKKFVFLYYGGSKPENMSMEQVMSDWMAWFGQMGDKVVDGGNPLNEGAKEVKGDKVGDVSGKTTGGYSIVNAESMVEAVEMAKGCPAHKHNPGVASVEVYEALPM